MSVASFNAFLDSSLCCWLKRKFFTCFGETSKMSAMSWVSWPFCASALQMFCRASASSFWGLGVLAPLRTSTCAAGPLLCSPLGRPVVLDLCGACGFLRRAKLLDLDRLTLATSSCCASLIARSRSLNGDSEARSRPRRVRALKERCAEEGPAGLPSGEDSCSLWSLSFRSQAETVRLPAPSSPLAVKSGISVVPDDSADVKSLMSIPLAMPIRSSEVPKS
mmetsp:Transcript_11682/g.21855  ORF Transcript_11682/g.21855 Transcript_11682/m.21855 type:complete len:221 (-) Transcript_11682:113-775(-)